MKNPPVNGRTRLSTKGQVVIPQRLRKARRWDPGTEFAVEEIKDGILLRPISAFPRVKLEDVIGCLNYHGPRRSLQQMNAAIARGAKTQHARG